MSITVHQLSRSFDASPAVDGVSFEVSDNELFVIVGRSGCGKSTLLRLLAGLEVPDSGDVYLDGKQVSGGSLFVASERRNVGFVFQSYALWPHMSVLHNVAFPAQAQGSGKDHALAISREQLATVDLQDYQDRKPEALSGGQRQRVALARCLAGGAKIVLMDEPLANLDPHLRANMERELLSFHRNSGATTIYITHDQREAMALADRMAVMQDGRFLQIGTPMDLYERPQSVEVAKFIGRGTIVSLPYARGHVELDGCRIPVDTQRDTPSGTRPVLFRPRDLELHEDIDKGVAVTVTESLYRGASWEVSLSVQSQSLRLETDSTSPVRVGQQLSVVPRRGWLIPD